MREEDFIEFRILNALRKGEPIKRFALKEFGITDRAARMAIQTLQFAGYPIINMQDGSGYKLAESEAELNAYKMQERTRAEMIMEKIESMRIAE